VAGCLHQLAAMVRGKSLIMVFSDLLTEPAPVLEAHAPPAASRQRGHSLPHPRRGGGAFPFEGLIEFEDMESPDRLTLDAKGMRTDYLAALAEFRDGYRVECSKVGVDYVPIDTSVSFDKALLEYLVQRQRRF